MTPLRNVRVLTVKTPIGENEQDRSERPSSEPPSGERHMQIRSSWGLMVLVAVTATVGCAQVGPTIRGQSPTAAVSAAAAGNVGWDGQPQQGPIIGAAPGYGQFAHGPVAEHTKHDFKAHNGFRSQNFGYDGGYYAGQDGYETEHDRTYVTDQGGCQHCQNGQACPADGCPHCGHGHQDMRGVLGHGPNGFPTHYQTYRHDWPQNMVYPQSQAPAAMVQYPYYTFRGPTDFFMK